MDEGHAMNYLIPRKWSYKCLGKQHSKVGCKGKKVEDYFKGSLEQGQPKEGWRMIIMSFKATGSGVSPKNSTIHRLAMAHKPYIIWIQEILVNRNKAIEILRSVWKGWNFLAQE